MKHLGVKYLTLEEVLLLSEIACAGEDVKVRDLGLLDSAIHRPVSEMFGVEAYPDLFTKAAALLHSIVVNHPFRDGNKRTGWLATVAFLDVNGEDMLTVDQDRAFDLVMEVAAGELDDVDKLAERLQNLRREEVTSS